MTTPPSRVRGWALPAVAAVAVAALVVAGALWWGSTRSGGWRGAPGTGSGRVTRSTASADAAELAAVQVMLDRREAAAQRGDAQAWLADVGGDTGFRARQESVLASLRALRVTDLDLRATRWVDSGQPGDAERLVDVEGRWSVPGVDAHPGSFPLRLRVRRVGETWQVVGDTAEGTRRQAFDLPGLQVVQTPSAVVVGDSPRRRLEEVAAVMATARPRAQRAWAQTSWAATSMRPMVVVPSTSAEVESLTGRGPGTTGGIGAITYGVLQAGQPSIGDKIVVNPDVWDTMSRTGREVVLTHELVHLLVRGGTTHPVPQWLSEGYAVHASYAGLDVDPGAAAPEVLAAVRAGRAPQGLPADARFEGEGASQAYDEAWLLVEHLVSARGESAVRRLYLDLAGGTPAEQAWARMGLTPQQGLEGWQTDLLRLASRPRQSLSTGPP